MCGGVIFLFDSKRKATKESVADISSPYTVVPQDDLYGSPSSWMAQPMNADKGVEGDQPNLPDDHSGRLHVENYPQYMGNRPYTNSTNRETTTRRTRSGAYRRVSYDAPAPRNSRAGSTDSRVSLFTLQVIGGAFVILAALLVFHSKQPVALGIQNTIRQWMVTDYTSIELPASLARTLGSLASSGSAAVATTVPNLDVVRPLAGSVVRGFSLVTPDVVISGRPGSPIVAAMDGLVDSAGESQANGFYVTIDHGAFGQTFYAHLGRLDVHAHEYVIAGQTIGYLPTKSGSLTFGFIRAGSYKDPKFLLGMAKP